jgi:hypothetical protein
MTKLSDSFLRIGSDPVDAVYVVVNGVAEPAYMRIPPPGGTDPSVTRPENNYSATSTEAVPYSVTALNVTNPSYQWQAYISDMNYTTTWTNIPGKTASAITIAQSDIEQISYDAYYYSYYGVRCVVTHDGGTLTSEAAHHAQYHLSISPYVDMYGASSYTYPDGSIQFDGQNYSTISLAGEGLYYSLFDMYGGGMGEFSWFSGDDYEFYVEKWSGTGDPVEVSQDWTVTHTVTTRQYANLAHTISAGTGVEYYRIRQQRPWPLTVTDGSTSSAKAPLVTIAGRVKVTWQ